MPTPGGCLTRDALLQFSDRDVICVQYLCGAVQDPWGVLLAGWLIRGETPGAHWCSLQATANWL